MLLSELDKSLLLEVLSQLPYRFSQEAVTNFKIKQLGGSVLNTVWQVNVEGIKIVVKKFQGACLDPAAPVFILIYLKLTVLAAL